MIHHNITSDQYYGVSHNDTYVLLCLGNNEEYVRLALTPEQARHISSLLNDHAKKSEQGDWP